MLQRERDTHTQFGKRQREREKEERGGGGGKSTLIYHIFLPPWLIYLGFSRGMISSLGRHSPVILLWVSTNAVFSKIKKNCQFFSLNNQSAHPRWLPGTPPPPMPCWTGIPPTSPPDWSAQAAPALLLVYSTCQSREAGFTTSSITPAMIGQFGRGQRVNWIFGFMTLSIDTPPPL